MRNRVVTVSSLDTSDDEEEKQPDELDQSGTDLGAMEGEINERVSAGWVNWKINPIWSAMR